MITRRLTTMPLWRRNVASASDSFSISDSATRGAMSFTRNHPADSFAISDSVRTGTGTHASDSIGAISDSA